MNNSWGATLAIILCLYGAVCAFLFLIQRSFIYYPTPESRAAGARDLRLGSGGETLQVWQLNPGQRDAILYFGGNAEDVALNIPDFSRALPQYTVYLVNYRGYGASTGQPSEAALFTDAEAVYDHVEGQHRRVHAMGRSLGSGVAVHLASRRDIHRLVLVTPYDSIANVAAAAMPLIPVRWLLRDRFNSAGAAPALDNPSLVLMAERDRVIPRRHSEKLVAALDPRIVTAVVVPGADHNTIGLMKSYWDHLAAFLEP
jgi:pimeloyl-ACP methyl ester carboxylesterase